MPSKLTCQSCQKTIRCNIKPIKCNKCFLSFHNKCAKKLDNHNTSTFECLDCRWQFPYSRLTDDEFNNELSCELKETSFQLNAEYLNKLFSKDDLQILGNHEFHCVDSVYLL